ncbi:hypothetical protein [Pontibacter sp. H249]|uniref:hypothetical protein n=1 Tax=Pontibacter sp. H249 TaxID=3133420 RepID=UPI0030C573DA
MQLRKPLAKGVKIIAFIFSCMLLLACVFDLQYSLLTGPFIDVLLLMGITLLGLLFSLVLIPLNGVEKLASYVPFAMIIAAFCLSFLVPRLNIGHTLHYYTNRADLNRLDELSKEAEVYEMTDMLRYQKRLNDKAISNGRSYTNKADIEKAFGSYITEHNLKLEQVSELRDRLENSNTISLQRTDDYLILTVDGFVDNEYGYVKSFAKELKEGETLPPFGFVIVRLIEFGDGWYFFYTT